jgi:ABC-type Mn2+/Zn2+ transport system permease subunit
MSLRAFHLLFIVMSVILTAFFAAWAFGEYRTSQDLTYAVAAVASLAAGIGLIAYLAAFLKKTKRLS